MSSPTPTPDEPAPPRGALQADLGVVLAAGASTRMGQPKALLDLGGRPLLLHHLDLLGRHCRRLRVVVGAHAPEITAVLPATVELVDNPAWARTGPSDSLLLAVRELAPDARVLVTPVDLPPASSAVIDALLRAGAPAVPSWRGRDGHPVLAVAGDLRRGLHAGTLRDVMAPALRVPVEDRQVLLNLNTPQDWTAWLSATAASGSPA